MFCEWPFLVERENVIVGEKKNNVVVGVLLVLASFSCLGMCVHQNHSRLTPPSPLYAISCFRYFQRKA